MLAHPGSSIFMLWPSNVPLRREGGSISGVRKGNNGIARLTKRRRPSGEDRARLMPDHGSRTHLGAFLPFRDELPALFDFFARFSTRAEAPLSLDASAGMVSRSAVLSPRKNKHPVPGYLTLRYDPRGARGDAENLSLRACDRRVTPTSARAPRSSTMPSKRAGTR